MPVNELLNVEKPARYMGGEMGAIYKALPEIRFALAFPDVYEVGMSHLGFRILYQILNAHNWLAAERVYAPWPDRETQLRETSTPLSTLESGTPLAKCQIVGFTLQYELSYTNILNMLDLARIPLLASERDESWPLIIGGGPCAYNPEPLADFFDLFLLGDGEEAVLEIAVAVKEWRMTGRDKHALLLDLAQIKGVYVPSFFDITYETDGKLQAITPKSDAYTKVRRRFVSDLNLTPFPTDPVIPFLKTVHDRVSMEIGRGCTRGCRFCQAGYIYRPVRERTPEQILEAIDQTLKMTGYDEVSLLSLSTGDYGCLTELLSELMRRYAESKVAVSFPSLRVGTLTEALVEEVKKVRKTGFTLAPEAGTERLRKAINKGISEEALLNDAYVAYSAGWRVIKLYFMIGLPGETMEDVQAIVDLSRQVKLEGRKTGNGGDVTVSVSSFVPKPHTPFQWEEQISYEDILVKQTFLRNELKKKKLNFKWHDAPLSVMEGVFARGDRRLGKVLIEAFRTGCRFDGWGEHFKFQTWIKAFASVGIDPRFYLRKRQLDETLPWDHLDAGVSREFLLRERDLATDGSPTGDCRDGVCSACGVCDFKQVKMRQAREMGKIPPFSQLQAADSDASDHIRIKFTKNGPMRYLSHLEMITLFTRAVARAGIPIRFSQGFHPHPKFSFATALSVGVESSAEFLEMELKRGFGAERVIISLNSVLPAGIKVLDAWETPPKGPSLSVIMDRVRYRVTLPEGIVCDLSGKLAAFMKLESFPFLRAKQKGAPQQFDLRHEFHSASVDGTAITMETFRGKPLEFVAAMTGLEIPQLAECRIEKLDVIFKD